MSLSFTPASRRFRTKTIVVLAAVTTFYVLAHHLPTWRPIKPREFDIYDDALPYFVPSGASDTGLDPERCTNFPRHVFRQDVQVVLKTGSAEARKKVPVLLETTLACIDDMLIFSDAEDNIDGHKVHDALADLDERYFERDEKLDYLRRVRAGNSTPIDPDGKDGWHVDKYKFIPMIEYAWRDRPAKKWFVLLETDSYIFWDNMLRHLGRFDSELPLFMGSPVWRAPKPPFAHGGSVMVLSAGAMRAFTEGNAETYGPVGSHQMTFETLQHECCGDDVLSAVLRDRGIFLSGYHPMFNGERMSTLRFSEPGVPGQWCEPLITLHHVGPGDYPVTHELAEKLRDQSHPLLHRDIYFEYVRPVMEDTRRNWNSMAEDSSFMAESPRDCRAACRADRYCYQFRYRDGTCWLGYSIRRGHEDRQKRRVDPIWHSGWMMDRVAAFEETVETCEHAKWVRPNPRPECAFCFD